MKKESQSKTVIISVVIVAIAFLIGLSFFAPQKLGQTVQVSGNSQLTVAPDEIGIYAHIQSTKETAKEAKDTNSLISNKITQELKLLNIPEDSIKTENYNVREQYDWFQDEKDTDPEFVASHTIKITVKDQELIGDIVDAIVDNGGLVNQITSELSFDRNNELKSEVLASAAADARSKAEAIASGLNMKVGKLVSVNTNDYGYRPQVMYAMAEPAFDEAQEINLDMEVRDIELNSAVSVVYELV
ncbi:SIMPL domain-containing protein [Candidatus Woesearchaeota archaeon]|nr:SIMPL domain-containing protein [Candidatus Woesearchaeota archaeon]MBT5215204.1 SIMPL domain-containing protein [Candidatus Woesearchaeota archaeon]MBT6402421.1 SIMPL domain-containing protein [Candidatus Woesearchaeota archaeon]